MSVNVKLSDNDPRVVAFAKYKKTGEYANTRKWALDGCYVDGSLWAAFVEGWNRKISDTFESPDSAEKTQPCGEHNTSSPKLPEFEILNQAYDTYSQQQTGHRSTEDEIDILKFAHKFIAGKIGR